MKYMARELWEMCHFTNTKAVGSIYSIQSFHVQGSEEQHSACGKGLRNLANGKRVPAGDMLK